MRLVRPNAAHYDSGPNMTPLVDVVMVILIFLMLTGSFAGLEHYLVSNTPITEKGTGGVSDKKSFKEPVEILVDSPSPDRFVARFGSQSVGDRESLRSLLQRRRQELNSAGTATDEIQVVISPRNNVKYAHLVTVYDAALDADYTKVSFATGRN